jgi:hypothetical protein
MYNEQNETTNNYVDRMLECAGCGSTFSHTARDQEFFAEQGFTEPKRCRPCRRLRKLERAATVLK